MPGEHRLGGTREPLTGLGDQDGDLAKSAETWATRWAATHEQSGGTGRRFRDALSLDPLAVQRKVTGGDAAKVLWSAKRPGQYHATM